MNVENFLKSIHGNDEIWFRFIKDEKGYKPFNIKGTYESVKQQLLHNNQKGYNVYFVVNSGGTLQSEINRVNAVYIDFDYGKDENKQYYPLDIVEKYKQEKLSEVHKFKYPCSYIIETRNGIHCYWLVDNGNASDFEEYQLRLIKHFHSDPAVKTSERVMKLPDYYWMKYGVSQKYLCKIIEYNNIKYNIKDILKELPELEDGDYKKDFNKQSVSSLDNTSVKRGGCGINTKNNIIMQPPLIEPYVSRVGEVFDSKIPYIQSKNIEKIRDGMEIEESVIYYTKEEINQYLKNVDLYKFLGVQGKTFCCLFHDDHKPSAGIIYDENKQLYIYNCFSGNCPFGSGTIRKCVEYILECDKVEALDFLMDIFNIELRETEWQKKQKRILEENMAYIRSEDLQIEYPTLYKRIKNYLPLLHTLHEIARDNLPPEHYTDTQYENLFWASVRQLANVFGLSNSKRISDRLALFAYLEILFKLPDEEIPKELLDIAEQELQKNKDKFGSEHMSRVSFFSIPSYSPKILNQGQKRAVEFEEKGFTMKGWSYEMLLRALGEEEAVKIYPTMKDVKVSKKSHKSANVIEQVTMNYIESQGWATEKLVINTVRKRYVQAKSYTETQMKKIMAEMLDKYGLIRKRLSKEMKKELGIKGNGYPNVILRG